ncbi:MAG TPA: hypothetical protein VMU29_11795 [Smithella sp.]|nr:hypothetical protein [Smithella sp.]
MDNLENEKIVYTPISGISVLTTNISAIIMVSIILAFAVWGYWVAGLSPGEDAEKSLSSKASSPADEWSYFNLLNLGILKRAYDGTFYVNRPGLITEYSYASVDDARQAFVFGGTVVNNFGSPADDAAKNIGAPAGTYGVEDIRHFVQFNDYSSGNYDSSAIPEYGPYVYEGSSSTVSDVMIFFHPSNGSGSGSGSGTNPSPTPLPGAFPLFGSGLALLWLLSRKSKF